MEFLHSKNDPTGPIDSIRVNWYYRPNDIQRKGTDTRTLFATMHSDASPISALRGKCVIEHRHKIDNFEEFKRQPNHFWYDKMFDRYIHRYYEVIPTSLVQNVPEKIRTVMRQRWEYILAEPQRAKELCSDMKECKRCTGFCERYSHHLRIKLSAAMIVTPAFIILTPSDSLVRILSVVLCVETHII